MTPSRFYRKTLANSKSILFLGLLILSPQAHATSSTCINSLAGLRAALSSGVLDIALCQCTTIEIPPGNPQYLFFTANQQQIHTQGDPAYNSGLLATIKNENTNQSGIWVQWQESKILTGNLMNNLIFDGGSVQLGNFSSGNNWPVIQMNGLNWTEISVLVYNSRGWAGNYSSSYGYGSAFCSGGSISYSLVQNALPPPPPGSYPTPAATILTAGFQSGCPNTQIFENSTIDVTDGSFSGYPAPGVQWFNNKSYQFSWGNTNFVTMSDEANDFGTSYSETTWHNNQAISSGNGFYYVGFAAGNGAWYGTSEPATSNGSFENNDFSQAHVVFPIVASRGTGMTITGNTGVTTLAIDAANTSGAISNNYSVGKNLVTNTTVSSGTLDYLIYSSFYLQRLYSNIFADVAPDSAGALWWLTNYFPSNCSVSNTTQSAAKFAAFTHAFINSVPQVFNSQTPTKNVTDLYEAILNRSPDSGGLQYYTSLYSVAKSYSTETADIASLFVASPEFVGQIDRLCKQK